MSYAVHLQNERDDLLKANAILHALLTSDRAEVARLRAALDRYGHHDDDCQDEPWHGKGPRYCSCGFYEACRDEQSKEPT